MKDCRSRVYFALKGEDFDPTKITEIIGISPTESFRKGERGKYNPVLNFSSWQLSTEIGKEYFDIDRLVAEIVDQLYAKIELINRAKQLFNLVSVLEIVLFVDTNEENSTPSLGHDLKTIEFLYRTKTVTDIDIYRFESK